MKVYCIVDGLGDRKSALLGNQTPLQAASKPGLDFLAKNGQVWNVQVLGKKLAPQSDQGVLSMLGVNPWKARASRGVLEALGVGIAKKKKYYFRANFASFESGKIVDRRVKRSLSLQEARLLAKELNRRIGLPIRFRFFSSVEYRGILELDFGKPAQVSNTDPAYERVSGVGIASASFEQFWKPCLPLDEGPSSAFLADVVNDFSLQAFSVLESAKVNQRRKREGKPMANGILLRDGGMLKPLPRLKGKWECVSEMPLEQGIGRALGMHVNPFSFRAGSEKKVLEFECANALRAIRSSRSENFYVHFKPLDVASHDGNVLLKKELVELLDKKFFSPLLDTLSPQDTVIVSADHATPCALKAHAADPVPFLAFGPRFNAERKVFGERNSNRKAIPGWKAFRKAFQR